MKTKPITLIVSLLFCLSGSVFAQDYLAYKPLKSFFEIHQKLIKSKKELSEIRRKLYKKRTSSTTSKNINNHEEMLVISDVASEQDTANGHLVDILMNESAIVTQNIKNKYLVETHVNTRKLNLNGLMRLLADTRKYAKLSQIEIDNATAVVAINSYLKLIDELEEWYKKNKDFKIK